MWIQEIESGELTGTIVSMLLVTTAEAHDSVTLNSAIHSVKSLYQLKPKEFAIVFCRNIAGFNFPFPVCESRPIIRRSLRVMEYASESVTDTLRGSRLSDGNLEINPEQTTATPAYTRRFVALFERSRAILTSITPFSL